MPNGAKSWVTKIWVAPDSAITLALEAKWRTLDSALLEVLGANDASRSQAEGAFWIGLSKSF